MSVITLYRLTIIDSIIIYLAIMKTYLLTKVAGYEYLYALFTNLIDIAR